MGGRVREYPGELPLYEEIAGRVAKLVSEGVFRPGERITSVRKLSNQMGVSTNTVNKADLKLEERVRSFQVNDAGPKVVHLVHADENNVNSAEKI